MKIFEKIKNLIYSLLKKSERYTQTDMVYLAKGGFWLTLGQVISTAASFLLAIAFANLLDPVTYGNYKYILSLVGMLGIFALTGIGTAIAQAVARGLENSFYTGFKAKLKWGLLGSLVAIGGAIYYWIRGNSLLPIPLLISAVFSPLMLASQIYGSFLVGRRLFSIQVKYSVLSRIVSAGAIITTLFITKNLFWLIAVYLVSHTLLNYSFYIIIESKFKPNKKEDSETLSYGLHLSLMNVLNQVAFYLDRILIFHYLGAVKLAIYQFAIAPPEQIKALLKNIQPLALPKFAKREKKEIKSTILKKAGKFFLILLPIVSLYILIAPFLYKIFFPQYLKSIFYSQLFILSLLCVPFSFLGIIILQSQKAQKQLYQLNIFSSVVQIIILFLFVYFYGLLGVVLARIISRFIEAGLSLWLVKKV